MYLGDHYGVAHKWNSLRTSPMINSSSRKWLNAVINLDQVDYVCNTNSDDHYLCYLHKTHQIAGGYLLFWLKSNGKNVFYLSQFERKIISCQLRWCQRIYCNWKRSLFIQRFNIHIERREIQDMLVWTPGCNWYR